MMSEDVSAALSADQKTPSASIDAWVRRLGSKLPGVVKFRLLNALEHLDRSLELFEIDREMASFRAITAEEEAAAALIKAIQLRRYPHAKEFNVRDHQHKVAVMVCVGAMAEPMIPMLREFQLTFDFKKKRADVKMPLSNFGVAGGEKFAVQPVEPLDLLHTHEGSSDASIFQGVLENIAARSNFANIKRLISTQANARNTLLYASDSSLPRSKASRDAIQNRKKRALTLLVLSIMVLQSRKHQALVTQAISVVLGLIAKLPNVRETE